MHRLQVITASTRPVRMGEPVAAWFVEQARRHGTFEVDPVDLKEIGLPMLDEPAHPRLGHYENEHTRRWSARVRSADAFVFVTPEYNHGAPPSLLNALDYLHAEWQYKPAGFVSYGGVAGGTRAVQMAKQVLTSLKVMPMFEAVTIPFVNSQVENGILKTTEPLEKAARALLDELLKWSEGLRAMRGG